MQIEKKWLNIWWDVRSLFNVKIKIEWVRSERNKEKERRGKTTKLNVLVWHLNTSCDYIIKHNKITKLWWCISKSTLNWKSLWNRTATVSCYFAENLRRYYVVNNSREEKLIKPENLHTWSKNIIKCHNVASNNSLCLWGCFA